MGNYLTVHIHQQIDSGKKSNIHDEYVTHLSEEKMFLCWEFLGCQVYKCQSYTQVDWGHAIYIYLSEEEVFLCWKFLGCQVYKCQPYTQVDQRHIGTAP